MTHVNRELLQDGPDRQKVEALFGSSPPVLLKAVGEFMRKAPGELDHHNLRIVAAAAPHVADPLLVAELVRGLTITGMDVVARPIDLRTAGSNFAKVLPTYSPRARQRLVAGLVEKNSYDLLAFSPHERLTERARDVIESRLLKQAAGPLDEQAAALSSEHATTDVVRATLDNIEARITRAERGTQARAGRQMRLGAVADSLAAVLDRNNECTTQADVSRAWTLVKRCAPDDNSMVDLLEKVVKSSKLDASTALSVLDTIDLFKPKGKVGPERWMMQSELRGHMIAVPEMPEVAVERAVRKDATDPDKDSMVDARWFAVRNDHYLKSKRRQTPLGPLSSDELDIRVVRLTPYLKVPGLIRMIKNPEALRTLAAKAKRLSATGFEELIRNPHTPSDVSLGEISPSRSIWSHIREQGDATGVPRRERLLITDPRMSDTDLVRAIEYAMPTERRSGLLAAAVHNPSAGPALIDYIVNTAPVGTFRATTLEELALATPSPATQRYLLALSNDLTNNTIGIGGLDLANSRTVATRIRNSLRQNATLESEMVRQLGPLARDTRDDMLLEMNIPVPSSPHVSVFSPTRGQEHCTHRGYGPVDVARKVIDGSVPRDRGDTIVTACVLGYHRGDGNQELIEAITLLADANMLSSGSWKKLQESADQHIAMGAATHPNCPPDCDVRAIPANAALEEVAEAIENGAPLPRETKRLSWNELPDMKDAPFPAMPEMDMLDGQMIGDRELRVIRNPRELSRVAKYMGNCLEGYDTHLANGSRLVATAGEGNEMVAIAWVVEYDDGPRWQIAAPERRRLRVFETNTRFNRGGVPADLTAGVDRMTSDLNEGRLEPRTIERSPLWGEEVQRAQSAAVEQQPVDVPGAEQRAPAQQPVDVPGAEQPAPESPSQESTAEMDATDTTADERTHEEPRSRPPRRQRLTLASDTDPATEGEQRHVRQPPSLLTPVDKERDSVAHDDAQDATDGGPDISIRHESGTHDTQQTDGHNGVTF